MLILGIGGILGDTATAILRDGELIAAIEESKLARRAHWGDAGELPERSIQMCLELAGAKRAAVDAVAVARPIPESDFHLKLRAQFPNARIVVVEHHAAHAASAYFPSPFDEATVLTLDRGGDFRSGSRWHAQGTAITIEQEFYVPDSLGEVYGRVTELLGLNANQEEHKVQWLSVAGDDRFLPLFRDILCLSNAACAWTAATSTPIASVTGASARASINVSVSTTGRRSRKICGRTWRRAFSAPSRKPRFVWQATRSMCVSRAGSA